MLSELYGVIIASRFEDRIRSLSSARSYLQNTFSRANPGVANKVFK